MASQVPAKKNTAFTLYFTLYKSDGTVIANPGTITKKVSIDGAAVADIAASVTEEDTTYGQCSVVLASGEMNGDAIWVYIKDDTSGCVPFTCTIYTVTNLQNELPGVIADAVWDEVRSGHTTAGTFGEVSTTADVADGVLDEVVEGAVTVRQMLRGFASALLSKASGAGTTTVTFRDIGDTKNRIVATVDESGNRSAITLTLT